MSEVPKGAEPVALTRELIQERTGFRLHAIFTGFTQSGYISPDLHEERERLSEKLGEDNVLPSMFVDDEGKIQLGLFFRESEVASPGIHTYSIDELTEGIGREWQRRWLEMVKHETGIAEAPAPAEPELILAVTGLLKAIKVAIESGTHKINIFPLHTIDGQRDEERPAIELAEHPDGTISVRLGRTDIEPISGS